MNECTEKTGRWPDAPADVSPDELDAFLDHAEDCNFHAVKLRAEEEELRSMFRLARGLDSHGRIQRGGELTKTIEKHCRQLAQWQSAAQGMKLPFKRIYLSNCGEDIAGSGKFYDFRRYEGDHSLDPRAGLQIWGVFDDEETTEEVLLGFYPLAGVRHTGEETTLALGNGYVVGLRVVQLAEQLYKVEFRCIEDEVLEKERAEFLSGKREGTKVAAAKASAGNSFLKRLATVTRGCVTSLVPSPERWVLRYAIGGAFVILIVVTVGGMALRRGRGDSRRPGPTADSDRYGSVRVWQDHSASMSTDSPSLVVATNALERDRQDRGDNKTQPTKRSGQRGLKQPRPAATGLLPPNKKAISSTESSQTLLLSRSDRGTMPEKPHSREETAWYFQSFIENSSISNMRSVVHTGIDKLLREKLFAEIHRRDFEVVTIDNKVSSISSPQQMTITWSIIRQNTSVTVEAILTTNGESKILTFRSDGSCPEQACERAVSDAVSGVFAVMNQNLEMRRGAEIATN